MGKERTYRSMYEDSFELYKFIDQFQKISNNLYDKEIPPMVNIMNSIITIKQNNDLREMKRLDLFFTKCLQSKVNYQLNKENFTSDELKKIVKQIKMFKMQMITNAKILLESNMIIQDIQHKVDEKYNEIINNNQQKISNNEPQRKFRK